MIEAHSALPSMSDTLAFCTLRILPRIGRSAWCSLSRASFAVPSAESPSTMKSSLCATSLDRQSTSFAGSDELSRAFLRRCVSLWARAEMRDFISATTLSSSSADCALSSRFDDVNLAPSSFVSTFVTMARTAGVPSTSLVWPSNCGSGQAHGDHRREPGEHVVLLELVVAGLQAARVLLDLLAQEPEQPLVEPGLVRAALRRGDDVHERLHDRVVAGAPAQGDVDVAFALQLGGHHGAAVGEHGHGLGEAAGAGEPPHVGERGIRREMLGELGDAALELERGRVRLGAALVGDVDGEPGHEERRLAGAPEQLVGLELGALREDLAVGPVADARAGDALGDLADDAQLAAHLERA